MAVRERRRKRRIGRREPNLAKRKGIRPLKRAGRGIVKAILVAIMLTNGETEPLTAMERMHGRYAKKRRRHVEIEMVTGCAASRHGLYLRGPVVARRHGDNAAIWRHRNPEHTVVGIMAVRLVMIAFLVLDLPRFGRLHTRFKRGIEIEPQFGVIVLLNRNFRRA